MLSSRLLQVSRCTWSAVRRYNVVVLGAASEPGQAVCLLLRSEPAVSRLSVYDSLPHTLGVITDLSHIPTHNQLQPIMRDSALTTAINDADLVLVTGGIIPSPEVTIQKVISHNTNFVKMVAAKLARIHPMPFVGIATEPVNVMVPMISEIMKTVGVVDKKKLFGITGVDALRAQAMYAHAHNLNPYACAVPCICGHSKNTLVPLLSKAIPPRQMEPKWSKDLSSKIRNAEDILTKTKCGYAPYLSMAHSILIFTRCVFSVLDDDSIPTVVNAYIENNDFGTSYFAGRVRINNHGVMDMERYEDLSEQEYELLESSITQLRKDIERGKETLKALN